MQIHIIGSTSMVGKDLIRKSEENWNFLHYSRGLGNLSLDRNFMDFSHILDGDICIFLAAISSPEVCEKNPEDSYSVNVTGTKTIIRELLKRKCKVAFFSSDMVYGEGGPFDESSQINPIGNYASMKAEVEGAFLNDGNFLTIRMSYVIGSDSFSRYISECVDQGREVEVYSEIRRNCIDIDRVTNFLIRIMEEFPPFQRINLAGNECIDRRKLAEQILEKLGEKVEISPANPPEDYFDYRPRTIKLLNHRLREIEGA